MNFWGLIFIVTSALNAGCLAAKKGLTARVTSSSRFLSVSLLPRDSLPEAYRSSLTHFQVSIVADTSADLQSDGSTCSDLDGGLVQPYSAGLTIQREGKVDCHYVVTVALGTPDREGTLLNAELVGQISGGQKADETGPSGASDSYNTVGGTARPGTRENVGSYLFGGQQSVFIAGSGDPLGVAMTLTRVGGVETIELVAEP